VDFDQSIKVEDRRFHLENVQDCFLVGRDTVSFLVGSLYALSREEEVRIGQHLEDELDLFEHATLHHVFEDEYLFYRFKEKRQRHCLQTNSR
jgi:hypothetical protein